MANAINVDKTTCRHVFFLTELANRARLREIEDLNTWRNLTQRFEEDTENYRVIRL